MHHWSQMDSFSKSLCGLQNHFLIIWMMIKHRSSSDHGNQFLLLPPSSPPNINLTSFYCDYNYFISRQFNIYYKTPQRSARTPKPGPLGGSVRDVRPPAGSQEKRPLLKNNSSFTHYWYLYDIVFIHYWYLDTV